MTTASENSKPVVGILSGISPVSGADYYTQICTRYGALLGKGKLMPPNPLLAMVSVDCTRVHMARGWACVCMMTCAHARTRARVRRCTRAFMCVYGLCALICAWMHALGDIYAHMLTTGDWRGVSEHLAAGVSRHQPPPRLEQCPASQPGACGGLCGLAERRLG